MMKRYLFFFLTGLITTNSFSQDFPLDTKGKISYSDVIEVDSLKMEDLFRNGVKWFTTLQHEKVLIARKDSLSGNLSGYSSFLVYSQLDALKKVSGRISYALSIDVKDNKYRYCFTDFVFHYCKPDRSYKMVETGRTRMLEDVEAPGWQKLWIRHRGTTNKKLLSNIVRLNLTMKERPAVHGKKTMKKTVEW